MVQQAEEVSGNGLMAVAKRIYAHADSAHDRALGYRREDETIASEIGTGAHYPRTCRDVVSDATREYERYEYTRRQTISSGAGLRPNSWRSVVRNRITVCCDYGNGGTRTKAVY